MAAAMALAFIVALRAMPSGRAEQVNDGSKALDTPVLGAQA